MAQSLLPSTSPPRASARCGTVDCAPLGIVGRTGGASKPRDAVRAAHARGQLRAGTGTRRLAAESILDDPVLERVVRDDGEAAARVRALGRGGEKARQGAPAPGSPRCAAPGRRAWPDRSCGREPPWPRRTIRPAAGGRDGTPGRAPPRFRARSLPPSVPPHTRGKSASTLRPRPFTRSAAVGRVCPMRMSSGPSRRNEKPRSARSSCSDETPRSARIAVGRRTLEPRSRLAEVRLDEIRRDRRTAQAAGARERAPPGRGRCRAAGCSGDARAAPRRGRPHRAWRRRRNRRAPGASHSTTSARRTG